MSAKLFVRNLSWSVSEQDLYDLFSEVGVVLSAKIPTRREDGKPRGFAFVEMASMAEGNEAVQSLNGRLLYDRDIVVSFQDENVGGNGGARSGGSRSSGGTSTKSSKLFVRSLSYSVTEDDLQSLFQQVGSVISVKIPTDRDTGESKGFGFVEMMSTNEAEQAINTLNQAPLKGKSIAIDYQDSNRSSSKPRGGGNDYNRGGYNNDRSGGYSNRW
ncbi:RNA recognition motif domain-containing protein [Vampirovibrio sp.]|uniref:RNA recognition motif domain-containing protein n=1 Tax=Vampirovibrio sp. TaxID=2717857 RepID=UPI003592E9EA